MDETKALESAIQEEAKRAMAAILQREADEIKRLDGAHVQALEDFKKKMSARTDARIKQEALRAENRAALDLKKFKLQSIEVAIKRSVEAAMGELRRDARYRQFLQDAVEDAALRAPGGIEVRLSGEDFARGREMLAFLKAANAGRDVSIVEDKSIKWGGCIVAEMDGGRIFDGSIERLYFRKFRLIRREVMTLMDASEYKNLPRSILAKEGDARKPEP